MKKLISFAMLTVAGLAALPGQATEVGLLIDRQMGKAQAVSAIIAGGTTKNYDAASLNGVGVRASFPVLDLKVAALSVSATYHPKTTSDLVISGHKHGDISHEYAAVGAEVTWKFLLDVNVGMDFRQEKITSHTTEFGATSATLTRPWIRAGVGMNLPLPILKPFIRLEAAVPVSKKSGTNSGEDFNKAAAPQVQLALYGGIRF